MTDFGNIAANAFMVGFEKTFDPHDLKEKEAELRDQQIIAARAANVLKEETRKAQKDAQLLVGSKYDPKAVEQVYNGLGMFGDIKFSEEHLAQTKAQGAQALAGEASGEYKFLTGSYQRDPKTGNIMKDDRGQKIFNATGEIVFETKQDMIDTINTTIMSPEMRQKMALAKIETDRKQKFADIEFEKFKEEQKIKKDRELELQKRQAKAAKDVATIQAKARVGAAALAAGAKKKTSKKRLAGDVDFTDHEGNTVTLGSGEQKILREGRDKLARKLMTEDEVGIKEPEDLITTSEFFKIQKLENDKKTMQAIKKGIEKIKNPRQLNMFRSKMTDRGFPERYVDDLVKNKLKQFNM